MRWRFGDCVLDVEAHTLERAGSPVHLAPKAFDLLVLLLRARPRALSKQTLHEALWPDTFVTDTSLTVLMAAVRRAIGDDAQQGGLVRTIHKVGYAFAGAVEEEPHSRGPSCAASS
jgi:DNA-binding winged helix-turn-helix (wHTH) protein